MPDSRTSGRNKAGRNPIITCGHVDESRSILVGSTNAGCGADCTRLLRNSIHLALCSVDSLAQFARATHCYLGIVADFRPIETHAFGVHGGRSLWVDA